MRALAQFRATLQRTAPTLLIALAAAIILVGKADQAVFEPLRIGVTDAAAPVLDTLSRPLAAAAAAIERMRGMAGVYQENLRLAEENRSLVCGMNLDFLTGLLEGIAPADGLRARLAPEPGYCCVRIDAA